MVDQWLRNNKLDLMFTEDAVKMIKLVKHLQLKDSKLDFTTELPEELPEGSVNDKIRWLVKND